MTLSRSTVYIIIACVVPFFRVTSSNEGAEPQLSSQLQELQERVRILQDQHGDGLKRQQQFMDVIQQLRHDLRKQREDFEKQIESVRLESDRPDKELLDLVRRQQTDIREQRMGFEKQIASMRRECGLRKKELLDVIHQQRLDLQREHQVVRWEFDQQKAELLAVVQQRQKDVERQRAEFEEELRVFREDRNRERDELRSRLAEQDETIKLPRSGELRTQKLKSNLVRTQSLNVLPLKSGVDQYIAMHVTLTARDFFLAYMYPSGPSPAFFTNLSRFFLC